MSLSAYIARFPERLATGAFVLHSGWEKWNADEETAKGVHAMAAGAYPFLGSLAPTTFLKLLSVAEMTVGALLLAPFIPNRLAGLALSGFSGGLLGLYYQTPGLRKDGSVWPTPQGLAISKDVWMFGIGSGLFLFGPGRKRT